MLGALGYTFELLPQLLDQLTGWLDAHASALRVGAESGVPFDRLALYREYLDAALSWLGESRDRLAARRPRWLRSAGR